MHWLFDNYETAEGVSLPRSTLYNHYLRHCAANKIDAVNAASFGKLIRSVFIGLKTRRLGTRYAALWWLQRDIRRALYLGGHIYLPITSLLCCKVGKCDQSLSGWIYFA